MPIVPRTGASIYYEVWGDQGPWVTLLNGHTRPLTDFKIFGQKLVRDGFRVLVLDHRGAGRTETKESFTLEDMVHDVEALWREVGCDHTSLLGISMGGFVAQSLALQYPQRVDRLILVSTAPSARVLGPETPGWTADIQDTYQKLSQYFDPQFVVRNQLLVRSMAKQIASAAESQDFLRNGRWQRLATMSFDPSVRLESLAMPTLVVHGRHDLIIPIHEAQELVERIRSAQLLVLEDTGHLILAERSADLTRIVLNFLHGTEGMPGESLAQNCD